MGNGITEETVNTEIVPFKHVAEETGDGLKEGRVICHVIIIIVNQRTKPFALEAVCIVDSGRVQSKRGRWQRLRCMVHPCPRQEAMVHGHDDDARCDADAMLLCCGLT